MTNVVERRPALPVASLHPLVAESERAGLRLPEDFPDGTSNTILLVEASVGVLWTKPADIVYDPRGPLPLLGKVYERLVPLQREHPPGEASQNGSAKACSGTDFEHHVVRLELERLEHLRLQIEAL